MHLPVDHRLIPWLLQKWTLGGSWFSQSVVAKVLEWALLATGALLSLRSSRSLRRLRRRVTR